MGKFKVGDRVRYVGNTEGKSQNREAIGQVGTVTREGGVWAEEDYYVEWDGGAFYSSKPYAFNLEPEVKTFTGIKEGDRVRFEANTRDYGYSSDALPTAYNGIEGTVTDAGPWGDVADVEWDISEIGNRASFTKNLVVIDRPAPARKTVVVEFDAPADENIENLVQQVTALTEVKYTIKEGK